MNIGPYCHFAQRDGVRAVFRQASTVLMASVPPLHSTYSSCGHKCCRPSAMANTGCREMLLPIMP